MIMITQRKINFGAGPAMMPDSVLAQYAAAVSNYNGMGMSILELPHRGKEFIDIIEECKQLVKQLCLLDDSYEVLWLQGGGRMQFCMVPMNFLGSDDTAGYIDSGYWAAEAIEYAIHYGGMHIIASSRDTNYNKLPLIPATPPTLKYLHLTTNNTIYGTQFHHIPDTTVPLIADMSSDILSCNRDYTQYGLFYAATQKNIGTAGLALVVVKKTMLDKVVRSLPPMLSYKANAEQNSILQTANVSATYCSLLMLRWIKEKGIDTIENENRQKAHLLYHAIDHSKVFIPHVQVHEHRSIMNICFTATNREVEQAFLTLCEQNNITGIKGHRAVGGLRVSLYNAIPLSFVETLVGLMKEFEKKS